MTNLEGTGTHAQVGRARDIPIQEKDREFVRGLRERALGHQDEHVFQHRQTLGRAYDNERYRAGLRLAIESQGTHGLCKTWASEYLAYLIELGGSELEAHRRVSQGLGHNRLNVLRHYLSRTTGGSVD